MSLAGWRRTVDQVDQRILELLSQRARLAEKIGREKAAAGKGAFVPTREKEIYARLRRLNSGPLSNPAVRSVFREIISACRGREEPVKVAYLGPEGTFAFSMRTG